MHQQNICLASILVIFVNNLKFVEPKCSLMEHGWF